MPSTLSNYLRRAAKFISAHPREVGLIFLISLIALVLRLYRIDEYLTFLGDEGRDVRVVRDLIHGNLVFIGPQTSIGNMYLGPLYYYMMAPALFLSGLNPVGPAVMVALLSVVTLILIWLIGRLWLNPSAAVIAAFLYALSPVVIIYSRASWNPNPMPLFALLSVYAIYRVAKKQFAWLILAAVALAFALQMHYLGLLLVPVLALFTLYGLVSVWPDKPLRRRAFTYLLVSSLVFLLLMSPLVLFDLKHQGMNFKAFTAFFTDRQTTINLNPARSNRFWDVALKVTSDLLLGAINTPVAAVVTVIILLAPLLLYFAIPSLSLALLVSWFLIGLIGLGLYKQHVYAHYFGFIFPVIYLLAGLIISSLFSFAAHLATRFHKVLGLLFCLAPLSLLGISLYFFVINSPLRYSPNRQLQRTEAVVDLIIKESKGEDFNFGLIAKQNYDESYRYFLENKQARMVRAEDKVTDQLFVVCEDGDKCQPEGHPQWQIAAFGVSRVKDTWNIDHIKVYRLIHSE